MRRTDVPSPRLAAAAALTVLLVGGLAACGGSSKPSTAGAASKDNGERSKSVQQVAADGAAALERAGAAHLISVGADRVDLRIQKADDATGQLFLGRGKAELRGVSGQLFLNGDAAFYSASGLESPLAPIDTWVRAPTGLKDEKDLDTFSFEGVVKEVRAPAGGTYTGQPVPVTLAGRRPALQLETTGGTKVFVSSVGEPVPLRIIKATSDSYEKLDLSEFGQHFVVDVPKAYVSGRS